jgi:hypothetical protein
MKNTQIHRKKQQHTFLGVEVVLASTGGGADCD